MTFWWVVFLDLPLFLVIEANLPSDSAFILMLTGLVETLCCFLFPAGLLWNIRT